MTRTEDEEHLKLLSVFHYVVGGLAGVFSLLPIFHLIFGLLIVFDRKFLGGNPGDFPPHFMGWVIIGVATAAILFGLTMASCVVFAGRSLASKTRYTFCLVIAGIECLFMPFGTVLGVFTIIVLMRESVKSLFQANEVDLTEPDRSNTAM